MAEKKTSPLAALPAVGQLVELLKASPHPVHEADPRLMAHLSRQVLKEVRARWQQCRDQDAAGSLPTTEEVVARVETAWEAWGRSRTCRVVNGSGIILHSGLGRAAYAEEATAALGGNSGYVLLEVDQEEGRRRRRDQFCADLLCSLTGAEAATVVNNNAAATMLILNEMGAGREIVVSRSQMIEIGGSFRLPDVFEAAGCRLVEVGTTNKSRVSDYEKAITENTGALMLVHTSNYRIVGFTEHVELAPMVALGHRHGIPVIHDLGSGSLVDMKRWGVHDEPAVQVSVKEGADVICFSGDKLVGGPQAGIIIGKKKWIDRIRKNPMARALRIDKSTCLALEATLKLYFEPDRLEERIPTLGMLAASPDAVKERALDLKKLLDSSQTGKLTTSVVPSTSELGAGTLPTHGIPTWCVALTLEGMSAQDLARRLRLRPVAIFSRIKDDQVHLDLRTIREEEFKDIQNALGDLQSE